MVRKLRSTGSHGPAFRGATAPPSPAGAPLAPARPPMRPSAPRPKLHRRGRPAQPGRGPDSGGSSGHRGAPAQERRRPQTCLSTESWGHSVHTDPPSVPPQARPQAQHLRSRDSPKAAGFKVTGPGWGPGKSQGPRNPEMRPPPKMEIASPQGQPKAQARPGPWDPVMCRTLRCVRARAASLGPWVAFSHWAKV